MAIIYTLFLIIVVGIITYRIIKKKSLPSNKYTPYDDITMGTKSDRTYPDPIQDTKHHIEYEERKKE